MSRVRKFNYPSFCFVCLAGSHSHISMLHFNDRKQTIIWQVQDSLPFSIGIASDDGPINTMSSNVLFRKGQPIPSLKMLTLHRSSAFNLEAFYTNQNELPPGVSPKISSFQVRICFIHGQKEICLLDILKIICKYYKHYYCYCYSRYSDFLLNFS